MALPTYDLFIEPILRILAAHPEGLPARQVHEESAARLGISEDEKAHLLPSGVQPVYKNRAGWAHDRLKRAGLSSSPRRGFWRLTEQGHQYARSHPAPLAQAQIEAMIQDHIDVSLRDRAGRGEPTSAAAEGERVHERVTPDDRLDQALQELRAQAREHLMETLKQVSPGFFEFLVLDLLHRMGYGTSREDIQRVGGSGDGGIDGIISLDKLGFEKVYVQAKRWQQAVGRPEVQAFYGALAGHHAKKGVFITTSTFTAVAVEFARKVEGVVLVDGQRLAELMIDHEVGVTHRPVRVPRIDKDYFDSDDG